MTIAPRLIAGLGMREGDLPCGPKVWSDTRIELPMFREGTVLVDVLGGGEHRIEAGGIAVGALTACFPVAVLRG